MAQPAPLANISFKRPKKDDTFPNVVDDYTHDLAPFCTPDHKIQCSEHWKNKLLELREIAPSAAVLTRTYHAENSDCGSEETETVDEEECNCIPEPLTSLCESQAINFDKEKLYNHAQKALKQYKVIHRDILTIYVTSQKSSVYQMYGRLTEQEELQPQFLKWHMEQT